MDELVRVSESRGGWYPVSVNKFDTLLGKAIYGGQGFVNVYALRKNIAYNLQYLEYIVKCLDELKLSNVIAGQNFKIFILVGCGIVESLLAYLLIKKGLYKTTEWELLKIVHGTEDTLNNIRVKVDNYIYTKLENKKQDTMDFNMMINKADDKKIFGDIPDLYAKLKYLRKMRNRVHLQEIAHPTDTDWNAFNRSDICAMAKVIQIIFTGSMFKPTEEEKSYFYYLNKYTSS